LANLHLSNFLIYFSPKVKLTHLFTATNFTWRVTSLNIVLVVSMILNW
jgi:hypothetical protein